MQGIKKNFSYKFHREAGLQTTNLLPGVATLPVIPPQPYMFIQCKTLYSLLQIVNFDLQVLVLAN